MLVRIYDTNQLAEMLGISRQTIVKMLNTGLIKGFKIGGRNTRSRWRVTDESLQEYINGQSAEPVNTEASSK